MFPRQLGRRIGRQGQERIILGARLAGLVAIGTAAAGVDDPANAGFAGRIQYVQRPGRTDLMSGEGVFNALGNRGQSCQVKDQCTTIDRPADKVLLQYAAGKEIEPAGEMIDIGSIAGGKIIQDADGMSAGQQGLGQVGTNEAGSSGD
jgi:hypothetical protein